MASLSPNSGLGGPSAEDRAAIEAFRRDVLEASLTSVVLVRFTADWCGPCKQLAPLIDKAVAEVGHGRVSQVVIDIDRQRLIAEQFRIQSVPTVYAFVGGQPVDGFVGAKSEREIKAWIEKLLTALPPTEEEVSLDALIEAANALLAEGDAQQAAQAFAALAQEAPERTDILAGFARALIALGELDASLARQRARGCRIVLGLRDILDDPLTAAQADGAPWPGTRRQPDVFGSHRLAAATQKLCQRLSIHPAIVVSGDAASQGLGIPACWFRRRACRPAAARTGRGSRSSAGGFPAVPPLCADSCRGRSRPWHASPRAAARAGW